MVLIASLTMPANAASWMTLLPGDYIDEIYTEGNYRFVRYDFQRTPLFGTNTGHSSSGSLQLKPSVDNPTLQRFYVYPLGVKYSGGPPLSASSNNVAIDVSEFKDNAALTISSSLILDLGVNYTAYDHADELFSVIGTWSFSGYGPSGNYVGAIESENFTFTRELQDVVIDQQFTYNLTMDLTMAPLSFSDNVKYIVPSCFMDFSISEDNPDICIDYWRLASDEFTITTRTDMLYEQSLTMEKIKTQIDTIGGQLNGIDNQLDNVGDTLDNVDHSIRDLNDKTDTIINGKDHQLNDAQDGHDKVQQNQEDMDDILATLNDYEEIDTSTAMQAMDNFLNEDGWKDVQLLVSPLIQWDDTVTIMLIVLSLINLSIILFGR